jgi:hypothetical protein
MLLPYCGERFRGGKTYTTAGAALQRNIADIFSIAFTANRRACRTYVDIMRTAGLHRLRLCNRYRSVSEIEGCFSVDIGTKVG